MTLDNETLSELEAPAYTRYHSDNEELWSEMLPGLWQGGTADFDVVDAFWKRGRKAAITPADFDTVITLYASARPVDWFVREFRYGFWDSHDEDDLEAVDRSDLFDLVRTAHTDWKRGKRVLIRCQAGWNRSGLVMALVLIREGWSAADAIRLMRAQRSEYVLCNRTFVEWLTKQNPADWQGYEYGHAE